MVPLRKEAALDYHRMGSKIYCLGSDGGKGEYASKEMIQAHEGLFGMESQMWERIRDQDLDYADEDFGAFQEPMSVIGQEEALKLYDAGADIYLITNFSSPIYVTERNGNRTRTGALSDVHGRTGTIPQPGMGNAKISADSVFERGKPAVRNKANLRHLSNQEMIRRVKTMHL